MNFLTLENITKSYGEKVLFQNITLHIDKGQKIGLIAKNGSGKTTLMRVIAGREGSEGEQAKIMHAERYSHRLAGSGTRIRSQYGRTRRRTRQRQPTGARGATLRTRPSCTPKKKMNYRMPWPPWTICRPGRSTAKVQETLYQFGMHDFEQKVSSLSGGQKKRLALVKILLEEPDFLILDEPTNHLDVEMIEWLEDYLQQPGVTLFMVTHDRYFLENVCDSIIELEGGQPAPVFGQLLRLSGEKSAARREAEATTYERQNKLLKQELDWVRRSPQARTTKAKARVDAYFDRKENNDTLKVKKEEITMQIKESYLGGKIVECHNISKVLRARRS